VDLLRAEPIVGDGVSTHDIVKAIDLGAAQQKVTILVNTREELSPLSIYRGEASQVEQHPLVRLSEHGGRPVSCQFADPSACETTVQSKGNLRRFSQYGNHEHDGLQGALRLCARSLHGR
jgi:hypothetical protein